MDLGIPITGVHNKYWSCELQVSKFANVSCFMAIAFNKVLKACILNFLLAIAATIITFNKVYKTQSTDILLVKLWYDDLVQNG